MFKTLSGGRAKVTRFDRGAPAQEEFAAPDPALALQELLSGYRPVPHPELPRFFGGAVGFFSYDVVRLRRDGNSIVNMPRL